jgi:hypothetical protein
MKEGGSPMSVSKEDSSFAKSSWIRKMFEEGIARKAKFGAENVFDLAWVSELEPPPKFREVLMNLQRSKPGQHGY